LTNVSKLRFPIFSQLRTEIPITKKKKKLAGTLKKKTTSNRLEAPPNQHNYGDIMMTNDDFVHTCSGVTRTANPLIK
jgi:hypothetical protein